MVAELVRNRDSLVRLGMGEAEANSSALDDVGERLAHHELQQRYAHIPAPWWGTPDRDGWGEWNDGTVRRTYGLLSCDTRRDDTPGVRRFRRVSVVAYEDTEGRVEVGVTVDATYGLLSAATARQLARDLLAADGRTESITERIAAE